jgi:hypothetical protein
VMQWDVGELRHFCPNGLQAARSVQSEFSADAYDRHFKFLWAPFPIGQSLSVLGPSFQPYLHYHTEYTK